MERTEQTVIVKNTTMRDVWAFLKGRAYGDGPVLLVGPFNEGGVIRCVVKLRRDDRSIVESFIGRAEAVPDADGVRLTFRLADFPDYDRFWQWADDLVLALHREYVIRGWTHTEAMPTQDVEASAGEEERSKEAELDSLRRQLAEEKKNLLLIQERKAEYVMGTAIPLDLVKQERRIQKRIEELEQRIGELEQPPFADGRGTLPERSGPGPRMIDCEGWAEAGEVGGKAVGIAVRGNVTLVRSKGIASGAKDVAGIRASGDTTLKGQGHMVVTGWNDGSPNNTTGSGYGIRISHKDRDRYFTQEWPSVTIELEGESVTEANLTPSFWRRCTELRGREIGRFLLEHRLAPWPKRKPPRLKLEPVGSRRFRLSKG
jgi:hypothetical protein